MSSLFDLLTNNSKSEKEVSTAKEKVHSEPVVELKGVNAPEFEVADEIVEVAQEVEEIIDLQEEQFEKQVQESQKAISIPVHDDGLDDDDDFEQSLSGEDEDDLWGEEELPFYLQTFEDLSFNTRTVNALKNAGYHTFNDIKGLAYSELLDLKGFGRNSLEEIKEYFIEELPNEDIDKWLLKRKPRQKKVVEDAIEVVHNDTNTDVPDATESEEVIVDDATESEEEVVEDATESEEVVLDAQIDDLNALYLKERENVKELTGKYLNLKNQLDTLLEENAKLIKAKEEADKYVLLGNNANQSLQEEIEKLKSEQTYSHEQVNVLESKVLVIGGSTVAHPNLKVGSFETIYAHMIAEIVSQAQVPSLAMIDYAKGWSLLGAGIRQAGWPEEYDVICVSKSYLSRPEMILELRLMADIVIEN